MTDLRTRIAIVQQSHVFCITECSCGHRFPWEKSTEWREQAEWAWARHVADAVIAELHPEYCCELCGRTGTQRFSETDTGWVCRNIYACERRTRR